MVSVNEFKTSSVHEFNLIIITDIQKIISSEIVLTTHYFKS